MTSLVTLTKHARIGVLTLNNPPVNALSHAVRVLLVEQLAAAAADSEIDAVVITCAGRTFVAGADIREFGKPPIAPDLPEVVELLDTIDKPLIAALHGTALGGGLELALACHYRLAANGTRVGLPEVTLGILPGAGGTQRLPRLVGVRVALDLIVRGSVIPVTAARALGLVDELVSDDLTARAVAFAESVVGRPLKRTSALPVAAVEEGVFEEYEQLAERQWRGFLAPSRCIAAIRAAAELPFADGLRRERELFVELMASSHSRAQRHIFFSEREVARVPGIPDDTPARPVKSAGVVGSGALAEQLVECFAAAKLPVVLLDPTAGGSERAVSRIRDLYSEAVARGSLKQAELDERVAAIRPALAYAELAGADLVLEAVPGGLVAKRDVFRQLDAVCKAGAVLASTSSWVDLDELASATARPADVLGMHFSVPLDSRRALEIARGRQTAADAGATAMKLARSLGKLGVVVAASPGLVAERLQARGALEALHLLEEGASAEELDRVLYEFGLAAGSDPARARGPEPRGILLEIQRLRGLEWVAKRARRDVQALDADIARVIERGYAERGGAQGPSERELRERYVFSMVNEAAHLLDEKVVTRSVEVDMICVHGLGFPVYRGGPLFYADEIGVAAVHEAVARYAAQVDAERWAPAARLQRLAAAGGRFYGPEPG